MHAHTYPSVIPTMNLNPNSTNTTKNHSCEPPSVLRHTLSAVPVPHLNQNVVLSIPSSLQDSTSTPTSVTEHSFPDRSQTPNTTECSFSQPECISSPLSTNTALETPRVERVPFPSASYTEITVANPIAFTTQPIDPNLESCQSQPLSSSGFSFQSTSRFATFEEMSTHLSNTESLLTTLTEENRIMHTKVNRLQSIIDFQQCQISCQTATIDAQMDLAEQRQACKIEQLPDICDQQWVNDVFEDEMHQAELKIKESMKTLLFLENGIQEIDDATKAITQPPLLSKQDYSLQHNYSSPETTEEITGMAMKIGQLQQRLNVANKFIKGGRLRKQIDMLKQVITCSHKAVQVRDQLICILKKRLGLPHSVSFDARIPENHSLAHLNVANESETMYMHASVDGGSSLSTRPASNPSSIPAHIGGPSNTLNTEKVTIVAASSHSASRQPIHLRLGNSLRKLMIKTDPPRNQQIDIKTQRKIFRDDTKVNLERGSLGISADTMPVIQITPVSTIVQIKRSQSLGGTPHQSISQTLHIKANSAQQRPLTVSDSIKETTQLSNPQQRIASLWSTGFHNPTRRFSIPSGFLSNVRRSSVPNTSVSGKPGIMHHLFKEHRVRASDEPSHGTHIGDGSLQKVVYGGDVSVSTTIKIHSSLSLPHLSSQHDPTLNTRGQKG
ncbi:hypothetical protein BDEG_25051 [Batrachochytrium dendrobatidis JEL423]|uniref:Uncharacterized protein n=1 Tax=Batrachochytrium dendrobatidis (strain JEL423) TaxID=403673 RepID=A0A177WMW0_BATDL|nr:hypothetical protein BDEG_25051 [Batrachochytrium dendrobatidis JEL423]